MRILFIDIDTLRPDHLGCYGYHRATSPAIDQLADRGVRFANVYASDVPCLPSRTALATGMFGIRNGVVNHGGQAADLLPWGSGRSFTSQLAWRSFAGVLLSAGCHTASFSSFPLRHGATWWTAGFLESMNPVRGMGLERADEVVPGVVDWLDRRGRSDKWFLHVHLWDPHTPYNAPAVFGNPFAETPLPEWHTEEVRARNWLLAGPHSAQEPSGFSAVGSSGRSPFHIPSLASMEEVRGVFDGYDRGVRSADDAVAALCSKLADLGVLNRARATLADWRAEQLARSLSPTDPLDTVLTEGGPMHVRGHLDRYLERLEETGRSQWIEPLKNRHRTEFASGIETVPWF